MKIETTPEEKGAAWAHEYFRNRGFTPTFRQFSVIYNAACAHFEKEENAK